MHTLQFKLSRRTKETFPPFSRAIKLIWHRECAWRMKLHIDRQMKLESRGLSDCSSMRLAPVRACKLLIQYLHKSQLLPKVVYWSRP